MNRKLIEKLMKWRLILAGWQLGTRPKGDPECDAVRDHRELSLCLRTEVNALTAIMIEKKIMTAEHFQNQVGIEAQYLDRQLELRFPGMSSNDYGMDLKFPEALNTMKGWRP